MSCEIIETGVPTLFSMAEGNIGGCVIASIRWTPRSLRPLAWMETPRGNRDPSTPIVSFAAGRLEKAMSQTSNMHVAGESDGCVLPTKCPNNGGKPSAEGTEGRQPARENIEQATAPLTQSRIGELSHLNGVRKVAHEGKRTQFTALLHHVTVGSLRDSFHALRREAAPGVDSITWQVSGYLSASIPRGGRSVMPIYIRAAVASMLTPD